MKEDSDLELIYTGLISQPTRAATAAGDLRRLGVRDATWECDTPNVHSILGIIYCHDFKGV